jgi:hypothetical protein
MELLNSGPEEGQLFIFAPFCSCPNCGRHMWLKKWPTICARCGAYPQAAATLEFHNNLPPDIEILRSADGRCLFQTLAPGELTFTVCNKRTGKMHNVIFKSPPILSSHRHELLDYLRQVMVDAIAQVQEP